jgi:peptide-methionine (S)-S-oxide reductase
VHSPRLSSEEIDMEKTATPATGLKEIATLGGGCFWCLEAVFEGLRGVISVESGYMGGAKPDPTYEEVCRGRTGHAEVVRVAFDPAIVTFREILEVFFVIHDPTTPNRQGNDVGTQYRSVVFHHTPEQKSATEQAIAQLGAAQLWKDPIVTEIAPAAVFYPAEDYHQRYFERNSSQPYCQFVVAPKLAKFRKHFLEKLKKTG